jgi:hypothetical protein
MKFWGSLAGRRITLWIVTLQLKHAAELALNEAGRYAMSKIFENRSLRCRSWKRGRIEFSRLLPVLSGMREATASTFH